jgi:uncharacterized membrane protein
MHSNIFRYYGMGNDLYFWGIMLFKLGITIAIIILIIYLLKRFMKKDSPIYSSNNNYDIENALDVAAIRYAEGEINEDEYIKIKEVLKRKV